MKKRVEFLLVGMFCVCFIDLRETSKNENQTVFFLMKGHFIDFYFPAILFK